MERIIPSAWLTPARCQRVIIHWTAGSYRVSGLDRDHYHVVLGGEPGEVVAVRGRYTPADNDNCVDRKYAMHVRGLNTGSFGLSAACMGGAKQGGPYGQWPLTPRLFERLAQAAAEVCKAYDLDITERTVLQHGEVQRVYGKPQSGKFDVCLLPWSPDEHDVPAIFRRKVLWYRANY